jgi:hypothetical protein
MASWQNHLQARESLDKSHVAIFRKHRQRSGEPYSVDDVLNQVKAANNLGLSLEQHAGLLGITATQLRPYKDYVEDFCANDDFSAKYVSESSAMHGGDDSHK